MENPGDKVKEIQAKALKLFNPIRPGLFSRSPGPGGGSEAQMPKIKVNINQLK